MFHSGIPSKKTPRLEKEDRRTEWAEGQKDILLNFIALALCSFLVSKLRQKYISTGFLFCLYSPRVSHLCFILAFCLIYRIWYAVPYILHKKSNHYASAYMFFYSCVDNSIFLRFLSFNFVFSN